MANTLFSKNLRKLREERQLSQKSVAASLGVSQALLSHYEKGIRECGLNFLTRAAKFYDVSTDYMLGVTDNPNTEKEALPCLQSAENFRYKNNDDIVRKNGKDNNINAVLYKNLLVNAITYMFDNMKEAEYKEISGLSGKYISLSIYNLFALLYANLKENNPFEYYNADNQYLNMIINGVDIKI